MELHKRRTLSGDCSQGDLSGQVNDPKRSGLFKQRGGVHFDFSILFYQTVDAPFETVEARASTKERKLGLEFLAF